MFVTYDSLPLMAVGQAVDLTVVGPPGLEDFYEVGFWTEAGGQNLPDSRSAF